MKNTRKIIPALAMLLVSAIMLASASYAWFTMSKEVVAQGMKVNIVAPRNLVISSTETGTYANTATSDETPANATQTLSPVSSITGAKDTFYAIQDNQKLTDGYKSQATSLFSAVTDANKSSYYADFDFWISTEYANTEALDIKVLATSSSGLGTTGFTGTLNGEQDLGSMRFAVIKADDTTSAGIYTSDDAYVENDGSEPAVGKAIASINAETFVATKGAITPIADTTVATIPQNALNSTNAQKVTIRVWCEGESNKCAAAKIADVKNVTLTVVFGY